MPSEKYSPLCLLLFVYRVRTAYASSSDPGRERRFNKFWIIFFAVVLILLVFDNDQQVRSYFLGTVFFAEAYFIASYFLFLLTFEARKVTLLPHSPMFFPASFFFT